MVVDQGRRNVADDPAFPEAEALLGPRLRVIRQVNLGGSGGFSRAMLETLDDGRSENVLLLDDDVVCEPEGIARAIAFARHGRRPTVVGGHMFSMHERSVLHAVAEVVRPWQFLLGRRPPRRSTTTTSPAAPSGPPPRPHRRLHADYTGWWMCLVPTEVIRDVGLSLPFFIKWDDAEFGRPGGGRGDPNRVAARRCRLARAVDRQGRQRRLAGLLPRPQPRRRRAPALPLRPRGPPGPGEPVISVKHVLAMQYGAPALRTRALGTCAGSGTMHDELGRCSVRCRRCGSGTPTPRWADADDFAPVTPRRQRKKDPDRSRPEGRRRRSSRGWPGWCTS